MERSLVLVKPEAVEARQGGAIISRFEAKGLKVAGLKMIRMDRDLAERHYAVHKGKFFFEDLINYITSGPIIAVVLDGDNAVEAARKIMGGTDPSKAERGTIRADFGKDIQRNAVHGSDSVKSAEQEIKLFFSDKELFRY